MLPDRVSNPGPLTYEPGALPIALRGPASRKKIMQIASLNPLKTPSSQTTKTGCTNWIRVFVNCVGSSDGLCQSTERLCCNHGAMMNICI